jgi:hypothetical protein
MKRKNVYPRRMVWDGDEKKLVCPKRMGCQGDEKKKVYTKEGWYRTGTNKWYDLQG